VIGYSVGDKVELTDGEYYLMALCPQNRHIATKNPLWEVRKTRTSHLMLALEAMIIRKISSNFEGFFPGKPPEKSSGTHDQ